MIGAMALRRDAAPQRIGTGERVFGCNGPAAPKPKYLWNALVRHQFTQGVAVVHHIRRAAYPAHNPGWRYQIWIQPCAGTSHKRVLTWVDETELEDL